MICVLFFITEKKIYVPNFTFISKILVQKKLGVDIFNTIFFYFFPTHTDKICRTSTISELCFYLSGSLPSLAKTHFIIAQCYNVRVGTRCWVNWVKSSYNIIFGQKTNMGAWWTRLGIEKIFLVHFSISYIDLPSMK